jgi:hypothetical protein
MSMQRKDPALYIRLDIVRGVVVTTSVPVRQQTYSARKLQIRHKRNVQ